MKKHLILSLLIAMFSVAVFTSCSKDEKEIVYDLAPTGTVAPPNWLIGKWVSGFVDCEVMSNNFIVNFMNFKDWTDLYTDRVMHEIKKTNSEYIVGRKSTINSDVYPAYHFKKGDGTYMEVASYDTGNDTWRGFTKYNKK